MTYASESGEEKLAFPRAGPELGTCITKLFESRSSPDFTRIFLEGERITGMGILYEDLSLPIIKLGMATTTSVDVDFVDGQLISGMYGAANASYITQLGFIVQDVTCTTE